MWPQSWVIRRWKFFTPYEIADGTFAFKTATASFMENPSLSGRRPRPGASDVPKLTHTED